MEAKPSETPKPKLYTCVLRCHFCLKILAQTKHIEKKSGITINFNECPLHPNYFTYVEWIPE
jgi:hypothetical protein